MTNISKTEAAKRQIDTAIDLYFSEADTLSAYTLAYASFKILLDIYPHNQGDGFDMQIDAAIQKKVGAYCPALQIFLNMQIATKILCYLNNTQNQCW